MKKQYFQLLLFFGVLVVVGIFTSSFIAVPQSIASISHDSSGSGEKSVSSIPFSVVSCSASSPYDGCYGWKDTYGNVTTETQLNYYNNLQCQKSSNGSCIKRVWWGGKLVKGDKLYYSDNCYGSWDYFWNAAKCSSTGCQLNQVSSPFEVTLATVGQSSSKCPTLVAWDYVSSSTWEAWSWSGFGWAEATGGISITNLADCYVDNDCTSGQICTSQRCVAAECVAGQEKCVGLSTSTCNNGRWATPSIVLNKCGVECLGTTHSCNGFVSNNCVSNKLISQGNIIGKCGVQCIANTDCNLSGVTQTKCINNVLSKAIPTNNCSNFTCGLVNTNQKIKDCVLGCADSSSCMEDGLSTLIMNNIVLLGGVVVVGAGFIFFVLKRKKR